MEHRIRFSRTDDLSTLTRDDLTLPLKEGQPFYDKASNKLYIGQDENSTLSDCKNNNIKPINANAAKYAEGNEEETIDDRLDTVETPLNGYDNTKGTIEERLDTVETPLNGYDNTKGTIEERLTSLGFKEGALYDGSTLIGSLYRQGNYIIGKFTTTITTTTSPLYKTLTIEPLDGAVETDFKPASSGERVILGIFSCTGWYGGQIQISFNNNTDNIDLYSTLGNSSFDFQNLCIGYEAFPITTIDIKIDNNNMLILDTNAPPQGYSGIQLNNLEIHYTIDGSDVTSGSPLYVAPIQVNTGITIKAALFEKYYNISNVLKYRKVSKVFSKQNINIGNGTSII